MFLSLNADNFHSKSGGSSQAVDRYGGQSSSNDDMEEDEDIDDRMKPIDELRHPRGTLETLKLINQKILTGCFTLTLIFIVLQSVPTSEPSFSEEVEEAPIESDCLYDRNANEHQSATLYVPECTPDGRYNPVQCYMDYCWCVNAETGKVIGGAISKAIPKCNDVPSHSRSMKGKP